jgi:DNA-binding GntR family transcriptional regulator
MVSTGLENRVRTLAGVAFESVRSQILRRQLAFGTKLNQASLAEQLGISLVPLREALRKLEAEGLVQIVPHRGVFVCTISRDELEDLYTIRMILEGMATRAAVARLTDDHVAKLSALVLEMEQETSREDYAKLLLINRAFHLTLYEVSGRRFLCDSITGLWKKSERYRALYVHLPGRSRQALSEHQEILQALQGRWAKEAVRAVRNNIRQTMTGLLFAFDKGQETEPVASEPALFTEPVWSDESALSDEG